MTGHMSKIGLYIVLASIAYDSDWIIGVAPDLDRAKQIAVDFVGAPLEWREGSYGSNSTDHGESINASVVGVGTSCDGVTIQYWECDL